ncbi:Transcriptional regulator, LysR family protein [Enhygromyxa salina]|uniref:Transcriptional regulator, LysR family protein n=1 Tax=Enhygromyxa salina TaxID=215803 RepID=A0A0C1Z2W6_9BACT|nr:LysR substrate-binding domain-containing protein [Enhygromyxa salina]KIG11864.1 Transcriptional regulator, LysR family protein [Enhygromyxa salina]
MDFEETRALLAVIDSGSFKAAAEAVKQPRATLRRRVDALEARAGVALVERSRSGVVPTRAGELLARQGRTMLRENQALIDALRNLDDTPRGEVRVGVAAGLPAQQLTRLFGLFQAKYPALRLHLRVCDDPLAELIDHVDIAIDAGRDKPPGHSQSRTLLRMSERLEASPAYLHRHGVPRSISELEHHLLLGWRGPGAASSRWPSRDGGTFGIEPRLTTNDFNLLRQFAGLGLGIALLPNIDRLATTPADDELIPVLEGVVGRSHELRAVVPAALAELPNITATLSHLERFAASLHPQTITVGAGLQGLHARAEAASM